MNRKHVLARILTALLTLSLLGGMAVAQDAAAKPAKAAKAAKAKTAKAAAPSARLARVMARHFTSYSVRCPYRISRGCFLLHIIIATCQFGDMTPAI